MDMNEQEPPPGVVVVVVPLPAQGHLNQLLHLSRLVSERRIPVHYVGSATHNRQVKHRVHGWDPSTVSNIHFHDLPLASFPTPPADPNATNKWPTHLLPTFEAAMNLREPLAQLLHSLSLTARRVVVVHDSLMSFAAKEASSLANGEAYSFNSCSVFCLLFFKWEALGRPSNLLGIGSLDDDLIHLSFEDCLTYEFANFIAQHMHQAEFDVGELHNTCRPIEGKFIDLLAQDPLLYKNNPQWAIGPLNPVTVLSKSDSASLQRRHKCLEWLDKQPPDSVLYVSFGTMTSISDKQIKEIATGLEKSEQRFIWVLREADRGDVYADEDRRIQLPEGYEETIVKGVGMIVRDWAPQLEILEHKSTGGFLSHCGWNSCMESLSMGVPMATWPMHSDQPRNTMLVTKVLRVGVVAREWSNRAEIASSTVIENAVRTLMVLEEGQEVRKRAKELGISIRQAVSRDGSSTAELDSFLTHISRP